MPWVAAAAVVAAGISAVAVSDASRRAAHTQADAANQATDVTLSAEEQQRADQAPWREAGGRAINSLESGLGIGEGGTGQGVLNRPFSMADFNVDPGYGFTQQQGQMGIDRALAAQGRFGSGALVKDSAEFNQGLASQQYSNAFDRYMQQQNTSFNRLASVAGLGQNSVNALGNNSTQLAGQIGQNIIGAGNANAAGIVGSGNAIAGGVNSAFNNLMMAQYMRNWNNPGSMPPASVSPEATNDWGL